MKKTTEFEKFMREEMREIRTDIKQLRRELIHYRGFVRGVLWAAGAVSAMAGLLATWWHKIGERLV